MKSNIPKIQIAFVAGFVVLCAAIIAYQMIFVWPAEKCEANGDWWDAKDLTCAVPIPISQFTGRHVDGKLVVEWKARHPAAGRPAAH